MPRQLLARRWTEAEIARLHELVFKGLTVKVIALRLKRTEAAIERAIVDEGLPKLSELRRWADTTVH